MKHQIHVYTKLIVYSTTHVVFVQLLKVATNSYFVCELLFTCNMSRTCTHYGYPPPHSHKLYLTTPNSYLLL